MQHHVMSFFMALDQFYSKPACSGVCLTRINVISLCAVHCFVNWPFSHSLNWKELSVVCGFWWTQTCSVGHASVVSSPCRLPSIIELIGIRCIINSSESAWLFPEISRTGINKKSFFLPTFSHSLVFYSQEDQGFFIFFNNAPACFVLWTWLMHRGLERRAVGTILKLQWMQMFKNNTNKG